MPITTKRKTSTAIVKRVHGRPTKYTPEIVAEICVRLARGETLISICRDAHMPDEVTVREWAFDDRNGFAALYARARQYWAEHVFEECMHIADDATGDAEIRYTDNGEPYVVMNKPFIMRARLMIDTRKWGLAKVWPKKYADAAEKSLAKNEQDDVTSETQQDHGIALPPRLSREEWLKHHGLIEGESTRIAE